MKKYFYSIFLFGTFFLFSQTLQVNPHRPAPGDTLKNFLLDTSAFTSGMPNSVSGNGVFWDFSGIVKTTTLSISEKYLPSSSVPSASLYPLCNMVMETTPMSYNYLRTVNTPSAQLEFLGFTIGTIARATFTNSVIFSKYPFTYGQSFTDPASGTFSANTGTGTINGNVLGSISVSADGKGTLQLGQQTIPNVLRLKATQQFTLLQGFLPLATLKTIVYSYYIQTEKFPLLTCQYQTVSFALQTPTTTGTARMNASVPLLGLNEENPPENIILFPNPARDKICFLNPGDNLKCEICSMDGRTIKQEYVNNDTSEISIMDLPDGIYLIVLKNSRGIITGRTKFIKHSGS